MVSVVGIKGSIKTVRALDKGLARHGDQYTFVEDLDDPIVNNSDVFIQTNLIKPKIAQSPQRREAYHYILNSKKPFLVIESPVFRRFPELKYTRFLAIVGIHFKKKVVFKLKTGIVPVMQFCLWDKKKAIVVC